MSQSTILNEDFSIHNIISVKNRNTDNFTKTPFLKTLFQISNTTVTNTTVQQKILTMFNFKHSQITQKEYEQLE